MTSNPRPAFTPSTSTPPEPGRRYVVVGVDDDHRTLAAVDWAAGEARRRCCSLLLVRVEPPGGSPMADDVLDRAEVRARRLVGGSVERLRCRGRVADVLVEAAGSAQLLVLGTRREVPETVAVHSFFASIVDRLPCPLVVVDGARRDQRPETGVLALVDAEPATAEVLDWGLDIAAQLALPLTAAYAPRDPPAGTGADDEDVLAWLDDDMARIPRSWDVSLTDGLVDSARRRRPGVAVHKLLDAVEAEAFLALDGSSAQVLVTDSHHTRRLLDVIGQGARAHLTVVVPATPVPLPPVVESLNVLDTCGWDLREDPLPPARVRMIGPEPRTYEKVLVPVRRPAPAPRRRLALWPDDHGRRR